MKSPVRLFVVAIVTVILLMTCSREPLNVDRTWFEDDKIFVEISGPIQKVDSVVATVREATSYQFTFKNSGENGDLSPSDSIWTYEFTTYYDASPGEYHLDISVYDKNGEQVISPAHQHRHTGKSGSITVEVPVN